MSLDFYLTHERSSRLLFNQTITHNLGEMASAAGLYKPLWRPDENGWFKAGDIVPALEEGLEHLRSDPDHYAQFDHGEDLGTYERLMSFAEEVLEACLDFPESKIEACR